MQKAFHEGGDIGQFEISINIRQFSHPKYFIYLLRRHCC